MQFSFRRLGFIMLLCVPLLIIGAPNLFADEGWSRIDPPVPDVESALTLMNELDEMTGTQLQSDLVDGPTSGPTIDDVLNDPFSEVTNPTYSSQTTSGTLESGNVIGPQTLRDDLGRYQLNVPSGWTVTTNVASDQVDPIRYDALVGLTSPDGEVISLRMWDAVGTSIEESLETYFRPHLSQNSRQDEGSLNGIPLYMATLPGVEGQAPSSLLAFLQCGNIAFRFEYVTVAGGSQLDHYTRILESFQCEGRTPTVGEPTGDTRIPQVSIAELASVSWAPLNPCQGYWDPNGNRYDCGQCTWWASYSRPDIPNEYDLWPSGNGHRWDDIARESGRPYSVSSTPEPGSIAVWEEWTDGAREGGHVAYVTWVNSTATEFTVTEMNWPATDSAQPPRTRERIRDTSTIDFIRGGVTFFEHPNFSGRWFRLRSNEPNITYGGLYPSSVFIPAGWDTIFYRDSNYGTSSWRHRYGGTSLSALESSFWDLSRDNFSDGSNMDDNIRSVHMSTSSCLQQPTGLRTQYETAEGCGDVPPDNNDTAPPVASGYNVSVSDGRIISFEASGVRDNSGGSGVRDVRFSAKWNGTWHWVGTDSSSPYTLTWDMCSNNVPNGEVELGMEVRDNAGNRFTWSDSHSNPRVRKESACGGDGDDPPDGSPWTTHMWMNKYLAGYTNWEGTSTWDNGYPYIWFDWGTDGPHDGWSGDEFSLRMWRNVYFSGGFYEFKTESDDGVKVYVDGRKVVDRWWDATTGAGGGIELSRGWHEVKVEYYENRGDARLSVVWYGPGYPEPDRANPEGKITSPRHLSATGQNPLTITAEAWDDVSGVSSVEFYAWYCHSDVCDWRLLHTDSSAPYEYNWNWSSIGDKHVWLSIDVTDRTGKKTPSAGGWVEVDLDRTNPTIAALNPTEGTYLISDRTNIDVSARDNQSGVGAAQFFAGYADGSGEYWHNLGLVTGADHFQKTWDASAVDDQRNVAVFVYVFDRAGNYFGESKGAMILDRLPPSSTVDTLPSSSPETFTLSWTGNDETAGLESFDIQYRKDNGQWNSWKTATADRVASFTGNTGVYSFRSRSRDLAGNVENWPPTPDTTTTILTSLPSHPGDSIGLYNTEWSVFVLRNQLSSGGWDNKLRAGPRNSTFMPVAGDWNGDGVDTVGLYNWEYGKFVLENSHTGGSWDVTFSLGPRGHDIFLPIAGDWNGDGIDTVGLYNPEWGVFLLRNSNSSGSWDIRFRLGPSRNSFFLPIAGDWNGDGIDTVGLYNPEWSKFLLRNSNSAGSWDESFRIGPRNSTFRPVAGDWNNDGIDTVGLFNNEWGRFVLKDTHTGGRWDYSFRQGARHDFPPIAGNWDGQ